MGINIFMNSEEKNIFKNYLTILENENISNGQMSQVSTTHQVDHNARFLPLGMDMDEEEKKLKSELIKEKLKNLFANFKSLIDLCGNKKCTSSDVSRLLSLMDNPEAKNDLSELKNALGLEEQERNKNASFSS